MFISRLNIRNKAKKFTGLLKNGSQMAFGERVRLTSYSSLCSIGGCTMALDVYAWLMGQSNKPIGMLVLMTK